MFSERYCPDISSELDLANCDETVISGGSFGDIYRGKLRSGIHIAIKCARLFPQDDDQSRDVLKNAARELYAWSKCQHVCVAQLLGVAQFRNQLAMVSRWTANGTLPDYIRSNPSADRLALSHQMATGLDYLHMISIVRTPVTNNSKLLNFHQVHGDIKGANVIISERGCAQLTDFGSSMLKHPTMQFTGKLFQPSFSLRWASPELIDETVSSSKESDIYALGMTILEAITGNVPYAGRSDYNVMMAVAVKKQLPDQPNEIDKDLWDLLVRCWDSSPHERPTATGVFKSTSWMLLSAKGSTIVRAKIGGQSHEVMGVLVRRDFSEL
ncbi:Tyrosine kinase domain protein [Ceratobasidium sp. AG-Ba]|nr:Tyrosine kinase domain protein [Ceratobasidium sp. AG-Ba]